MLEEMKEAYETIAKEIKFNDTIELENRKEQLLKILAEKPTSKNRKERMNARFEIEEIDEEIETLNENKLEKAKQLDVLNYFKEVTSKVYKERMGASEVALFKYLQQIKETLPILKREVDKERTLFTDEYNNIVSDMRNLVKACGYSLNPAELNNHINVGVDYSVTSELTSIKYATLHREFQTYQEPVNFFEDFPDKGYSLVGDALIVNDPKKYNKHLREQNKE